MTRRMIAPLIFGILGVTTLGFYVDAEILSDTSGRHRVYLSTFTVENVAIYQSGDHVVRALRLRRRWATS